MSARGTGRIAFGRALVVPGHVWIIGAVALIAGHLASAQNRRVARPSDADAPRSGYAPQALNLPDAPEPTAFAIEPASAGVPFNSFDLTSFPPQVSLQECPYDQTHAHECRVHWRQLLIESAVYLAFQNAGNLYTGYWYRYETTHGEWWDRYIDSAAGWRWDRWSDNNPFLDDYVGHPIMGGITSFMWIQNDPKGMTLVQSNTWPYWRSRLRALAFTTAYSFEWKLGPIGEASIGHNGDHYYVDKGVLTNETGWVELVTTPVGGFLWTLAEDRLDRSVIARLENSSRKPWWLLTYQFLNPARATANILRFRPPWYRDTRTVKADSFWSDPKPVSSNTETAADQLEQAVQKERARTIQRSAEVEAGPYGLDPFSTLPGGVHEFGGWWGLSLMTGHLWGAAKDIKYMPIDVRYSYLISLHRRWALRYSPELTALAMLDEPVPGQTNPELKRKRTYGSGLSPEGFQLDLLPARRVQPFLSNDGGFIYFTDRVLSPQGSQWMYTIDFGVGINIFRKRRQAVTIGYRYQHLSNADISLHNPGTDANTFYVGVSRFRTKMPRFHR